MVDLNTKLQNLPAAPGVYRMLNAQGEVIYVGKAKNLKKRVSSYFSRSNHDAKTDALVAQIVDLEISITHTEKEALLLELNLIKKFQPHYNVLLRDDKSYPYIFISSKDQYPRLDLHRGPQKLPGHYHGPYPSASAAHDALHLMQKLFKIRQCSNSFFKNRSRPCLQYQIKRCTAPCVGYITPEAYKADVAHAELFLAGKSDALIENLMQQMHAASESLNYETAAQYRDLITSLRKISQQQAVNAAGGDYDVIVVQQAHGAYCVQVLLIRDGRWLGSKAFFPKVPAMLDAAQLIATFIGQYYLLADDPRKVPRHILLNVAPEERSLLETTLSDYCAHKVSLTCPSRGERKRWIDLAITNASHALTAQLRAKDTLLQRFSQLQQALQLDALPQRLECFDISHTQGEATQASCVVFDHTGPVKADYRRFKITDVAPGDDYAAMRQAVLRRYTHVKANDGKLPDILLIDGGKGQLHVAQQALEELQLTDVVMIGVAKGLGRKAGLETLWLPGQGSGMHLPEDSPALHLIQQIRDEAHRFAITGHRKQRAKARKTSTLESIAGIGPKRRRELLARFGGLQGLRQATVEEIAKVPGMSKALAERVYAELNRNI